MYKMFKKFTVLLLSAAILLPLYSCKSNNDSNAPAAQNTEQASAAKSTEQANTAAQTDTATAAATPAATEEAASNPADATIKYSPEIEISSVKYQDEGGMFYDGDDFSNNIWTRSYEKDLGIKTKILWSVPTSQYDARVNLAIASNEIPDVFEVNDVQYSQLLNADMLTDMTGYYNDGISDESRRNLEGDGGAGLKKYTSNGKLMAIPRMDATYDSAPLFWIRKDWMENLGLQPPKTTEELLTMARRFATDDPDKNGENDTIGFAFEKALFGEFATLNAYFNSFKAYPKTWIKSASGDIVYGGIQPEVKTALGELAKLYQEGILDKEFGVKDNSKIAELITSGKLGLVGGQHWNAYWPLPDSITNDPNAQWYPYAIPSMDGSGPAPAVVIGVKSAFVVSKSCKNPEAIIKLMNYFWDVDFSWSPHYTNAAYQNGYSLPDDPLKADPDKPAAVGFKAALLFGNNPTQNLDIHMSWVNYLKTKDINTAPMLKPDYTNDINGFNKGVALFEEINRTGNVYTDVTRENQVFIGPLWVGTKVSAYAVIKDYIDKGEIVYPEFYVAPTPTMSSKQSTLDKLMLETFTRIIMGSASIDEFDKFVEDWKSLGGEQITAEVNEWARANK